MSGRSGKIKFLKAMGIFAGFLLLVNAVFIAGVMRSLKPSYTFFSSDDERIAACRDFRLKDNAGAVYTWRRGRDEKGIRVILKSNSIADIQSQFDLPVDYSSAGGAVEVFSVPYKTSEDKMIDCAGIDVTGLYEKIGPHEIFIIPEDGGYVMEIVKWH
ncbi:MAG: hypothetical protein K6C13_03145 [Oscillospiraceae bacterium]|nr:hypothetical protein [Oscillospiraceae bacterium]